ncbi:MAG: hypothetical protein H6574_21485 [Lewinellaceae bacterium]|nr:hypothetical protein [Saprospiraceae bacterium]MCB9316798.1 hypothetical protein [Lewinellaceae bacterium]MCB9333637.1 hypothetical protein [Lewinellaceae bacterium]
MFIGHFALGFGAKAAAPRVSLGALFFAVQFVDLLWPSLLLLGMERVEIQPGITVVTPLDFVHYPYTHSLLMAGVWAVLIGGVYYLLNKQPKAALVLGACVASHWFIDLIVHRPDLPLSFADTPVVGLGLWNSLVGTVVVEVLLFVAGLWIYLRHTKATKPVGVYALWGLVTFLLVIYGANLFGPPPPDVRAIAIAGHAQWLLVLWAYWVDKNREAR